MAKDIMISGKNMPVISINKSFNDALKIMNKKKLGIVVVTKKIYFRIIN